MEEKLKKQITILEIVRIALIFFIVLEIVLFVCMIRQNRCNSNGGGLQYTRADAHNIQFLQYQGTQTGGVVRTLISTVEQYNISGAANESEFILVKMGTDVSKEIYPSNGALEGQSAKDFNKKFETVRAQIKVENRYDVTFAYDENTGYVVEIGIQEVQNN